ncbi:uncharacterized protein LOC117325568 [Pecten maximus]|uniref:uncharacterized protein LOC117325568 n=1 Tax=Pecten maximus TaxID=6579 RepID=UPI001458B721|nr:uncharacterized protein LOC117325568 [Pecten maximus]
MFAFARMSGNNLATYEWNDEAQYAVVMSKKLANPDLKVMLAVGGYTHGVQTFSAMVSSLANIEEFAANAIIFLRQHGFDGLDLDWEYPAHRGSPAGDREKFTQLTMVLRQEFDKEGSATNRPALLLSAAVSASKETVDTAYEIGLVSQYVDFINLMSYDFHGTWDSTAGHNSPLYNRTGESGNELYKNQNAGVEHWLSNGTPAEKLVLGLALYGRSFTLASSSDTSMGSAVVGAGNMGTYTSESGYLGYFEICDRIENNGWTRMWHNEHQVPFAYAGNQWVGFDDVQSFGIKAEYIKSMGLGGSMVWAMDLDDHNNICRQGVNPMMTVLKTVLESTTTASTMSQQPTVTAIPTTTNHLTVVPSSPGNSQYKRVCYFTNWAQYRTSPATYTAADIDAHLCTHIMFAFARMSGNNLATYEWNDEAQYAVVMSKKLANPDLKVMLAVGGYTHGVQTFSAMVSSLANIEEFAANAIIFLRQHGFDGLDLDWEYPAHRGSPAGDREKFTQLTMVLRQEFDKEGSATNRPALLLSAAVSASKETVDTAYEIGLVSQYVDFINLMSYDFHGTWDSTAGHNSPLYNRTGESGNELYKNQNAGVEHWLSNGTPAEKLVLGLALYGRSFTLASSSDTSMGSAVVGAGNMGTYTSESGYLGYFEICDRIENNGWTRMWHNEHQVPFAYAGNQWVGFDDVQSFGIKAEYIKSMGLGGSMVWAMDLDDHNNICRQGVNPMMTVLKTVLESTTTASTMSQQPTVTAIPTTTNHLTVVPSSPGNSQYKRVCYFTNWAQYRTSPATYTAADIDAHLCTHIMFAFARMSGNNLATYEWNDEAQYAVVMSKKLANPDLKVMLAVGGYTHGVQTFSAMVSSLANIEEFAANAIIFLRQHGFDGLDLDWEYPAHRGSPAGDREKFTQLTMVLRQEFDKEGSATNRPALLLSAAVSASKETVDTAYEIGLVSQYVDFINLMSYDFHGTWDSTAGHNSPLYNRTGESGNELYKNQNAGVEHWLSNGTPAEKLVLGLALYGRSFTLASSSDTSMGSAVVGAGNMGTYTSESGYLGYFEICDRIENNGWTRMWHNEHQVPFAYAGNQWVGFDDVQSFGIKAEYIKSMGLGGSMVWAMDLDDHSNICGQGVNPMMTVLKTVLESITTASTISQQPTVTAIPTTTNLLTGVPSSPGMVSTSTLTSSTSPSRPGISITSSTVVSIPSTVTSTSASMSNTVSPTSASMSNTASPTSASMSTTASSTSASVSNTTSPTSASMSNTASPTSASMSNTAASTSASMSNTASPTNASMSNTASSTSASVSNTASPTSASMSNTASSTSASMSNTEPPTSDSMLSTTSYTGVSMSSTISSTSSSMSNTDPSVIGATSFTIASTSSNNCEPTVCPGGQVLQSLCDSSCVFQCCIGGNIQHCCQSGYTWNNAEEKCQMIATSTSYSNVPNCDVPTSCTHGEFLADQCDLQCYYNCAHGTAYHYCCAAGSLWDDFIKACNHPHLIQYDQACHHSVCPPHEFLPDPCVPECYYQCSPTGVDFRYCCSEGLLWDQSIKNCNYPGAIPPTTSAPTTSTRQANTSSQTNGEQTGTAIFHSIIVSDCNVPMTSQTESTSMHTPSMTSLTGNPTRVTDQFITTSSSDAITPTMTSTHVPASIMTTTGESNTSSNSSLNICEPTVCPDGQVLQSLCDSSCVFQCCIGGNIQHCCQSGYTWNDADENCQMTVTVSTTSANNIPNCDVPTSCTHGEFLADQCDLQCYYNCAHGTAYHYCCAAGSLWDDFIKACNHPHLIQYDQACHHDICPPHEFLPDPCVPECYYQCSTTGVDFRYCCSQGLLWDESIKNCNYPAAMPPTTAPTTGTNHLQNGGQTSGTVVIHQIIFSNCVSTGTTSNDLSENSSSPTSTKSDPTSAAEVVSSTSSSSASHAMISTSSTSTSLETRPSSPLISSLIPTFPASSTTQPTSTTLGRSSSISTRQETTSSRATLPTTEVLSSSSVSKTSASSTTPPTSTTLGRFSSTSTRQETTSSRATLLTTEVLSSSSVSKTSASSTTPPTSTTLGRFSSTSTRQETTLSRATLLTTEVLSSSSVSKTSTTPPTSTTLGRTSTGSTTQETTSTSATMTATETTASSSETSVPTFYSSTTAELSSISTTTPAALSGFTSKSKTTSIATSTVKATTVPSASSQDVPSSSCASGLCDTDSFGNNNGCTITSPNGTFAVYLSILIAACYVLM